MPSDSVALPDVKTWEVRNKKTGEVRTFEQSELSIEGEVRIVQLAGKTIQKLSTTGFPWDELARVIGESGDIDWNKASDMLMMVITEVPEFVAESTAILFSLYPVDDNGKRNPEYDKDKVFLRQGINFTQWVEIIETFTLQNDYQRLARPFSMAAARAMETGMLVAQEQKLRQSISEASSPVSTLSSSPDTETPSSSSETTHGDSSSGTQTP